MALERFFQLAREDRVADSVTSLDNFARAKFFKDLLDKKPGCP